MPFLPGSAKGRTTLLPLPPTSTLSDMMSKSPTTIKTIVLEKQMDRSNISCWDFAYPTGKSSVPPRKSCFLSKQQQMGSTHHEVLTPETSPTAPAHGTAQPPSQSSPKSRSKNKKHAKTTTQPSDSKTYLLSSPTAISITYPYTLTTISTLLSQPNTKVIYLVPQCQIVCPKVCDLMRLPRAAGSAFQVLPVGPETDMLCGTAGSDGTQRCPIKDAKCVQKVVDKVLKNTKTREFDGFISFEEDREAWTFLERVGKGVKAAGVKNG